MTIRPTRSPILFEDDTFLIVNKPAGVLSHPNHAGEKKACAFEGTYHFPERRFDSPAGSVWLVHRLDQDASGVLMAVKSQEAAQKCRIYFEKQRVFKTYLALVSRQPEPQKGKWQDCFVEERRKKFIRSAIDPRRRPNSELTFSVKRYFPHHKMALLEVYLITGRTHQIRVQAAHHGHPVAGDGVYGDFKLNRKLRKSVGLRRLFLHAFKVRMRHPGTHSELEIEAPLSPELEECMRRMA